MSANEQDVRELAVQHRELQKQAESIQQQMGMIRMTIEDCTTAIMTLEEVAAAKERVNT